jgi:hypothetical protein
MVQIVAMHGDDTGVPIRDETKLEGGGQALDCINPVPELVPVINSLRQHKVINVHVEWMMGEPQLPLLNCVERHDCHIHRVRKATPTVAVNTERIDSYDERVWAVVDYD